MAFSDLLPLVVAAVSACLAVLLAVPSIWRLRTAIAAAKSTGPIALKERYEDADGVATEQDEQNFSDKIPKIAIYITVAAGAGTSLASAVLSTVNRALHADKKAFFITDWITAGIWILLILTAVYIMIERRPVYRFDAGLVAGQTFLLLLVSTGLQTWYISENLMTKIVLARPAAAFDAHFKLAVSQLVAAALGFIASLSLPRRPSVHFDGKPIDAEFTVSAWGRFTYNWDTPLLSLAAKRTLEFEDLPNPAFNKRSGNLLAAFNPRNSKGKLLKLIVLTHWVALLKQLVFTMLQTLFSFVPQLSMFFLLRELEKRAVGEDPGYKAWFWVAAFTVGSILQSATESWMFWISNAELLIPLKSELSAMVFTKAMRSKDVKEAVKTEKKANPEANGNGGVESSEMQKTNSSNSEQAAPVDEEEAAKKQRQSIVNLLAIDTKRVSDFGSLIRYFPQSILGLCTSLIFLVAIIGWIPLIAGFLASLILLPPNIVLSKHYNRLSKNLMKIRDEKLACVNEALGGMRQIKFSALEKRWEDKIFEVRNREISQLCQSSLIFCWNLSPLLLSTVSLASYAYLEGGLSPSVAFTALGVFGTLQQFFVIVPHLTTMLLEAGVSLGRISTYLAGQEKETQLQPGDEIEFNDASISWPRDTTKELDPGSFALRNLDLKFPSGQLSVISGKTGSGKSLLLSSIFGECEILSGTIKTPQPLPQKERFDEKANASNWILPNSIAFVAQIPWIENSSIRENIVFGLPFDETRYDKTLSACELTKDLEMLEDGDLTEIGATGINLSGGQRWRVTLARALYSRAGILILDDIFSAVDTHVGRSIFENALVGELSKGRTRILATHHASLVISKTSYVVQLGKGTIEHAGATEDLSKSGDLIDIVDNQKVNIASTNSVEVAAEIVDQAAAEPADKSKAKDTNIKPRKFVEDEYKEVGAVKKKVYMGYLQASGGAIFWGICLLLFILSQTTDLLQSWWVVFWTGNNQKHSNIHATFSVNSEHKLHSFPVSRSQLPFEETEYPLSLYIGVYFAIGIASSLLNVTGDIYIFFLGVKAARTLFKRMTSIVLRMPLRWVDTVPTGRILNRFTGDFNTIDKSLPSTVANVIGTGLQVIAVLCATILVSPSILILGVVLIAFAVYTSLFFLHGARSMKRLDSITKSPVLEQLGSALAGVNTIRAFDKTDNYENRMFKKIDNSTTTLWYLTLTMRWFTFRLAIIGAGFTTAVAIFVVGIPTINAALAGFALTFALRFSNEISWFMRMYSECEINMNAAERVLEYTDLKSETAGGEDAPAAWPTDGKVSVKDVVVGYADDLPAILKGLSFEVEGGQRVGIIGRTGAGKSSLALTLFRFLEARSGTISIDGRDISKLKLFDLRSRLAIIPQDPTIFSGTIRSNLDPFDEAGDEELKAALLRVHLASDEAGSSTEDGTNRNIFNDLSSVVSEGGLNLSQGQRQLLCLARSIVKRSKVLILDEATSAVDMETDALIQRSIREDFQGSTLLVIAHRLSTIADFDRILVMSEGRAEEFGSPKELWAKKGAFYDMVQQSGEKKELENIILG